MNLPKELKEIDKWNKEHLIRSWLLYRYYAVERTALRWRRWHKYIYWFIQEHLGFYSKRMYWNLGHNLSIELLKRIKHFRKMERMGYPDTLKSQEEWDKVLDKIIWALEREVNEDTKYDYKKQEEGLKLLGKYLINLWD